MQSGSTWKLVPETDDDLADVVNVVTEETQPAHPELSKLRSSYPNPFNQKTTVSFSVSESGRIKVEVFDMLGRGVRILVDDDFAPGRHEVTFEADGLASGPYLIKLTSSSGSDSIVTLHTE